VALLACQSSLSIFLLALPAAAAIVTLSLHDALPICCRQQSGESLRDYIRRFSKQRTELPNITDSDVIGAFLAGTTCRDLVNKLRSEEHTSELQSRFDLVCRLLLEKKKKECKRKRRRK